MLVTYRTYEVPEVNEGINTALAQIQTGSPKGVKTFAQVINIEDTWTFLETNVLRALKRADTDCTNCNDTRQILRCYYYHFVDDEATIDF